MQGTRYGVQGLSESEVLARRARGLGNSVQFRASRTYVQILRQNAFTFINVVLFAVGIVLVLMRRSGDAVVTAGLVLLYVVVAVVQEGRAKHKLDRIALLTRPKATVIRGGRKQTIDPDEVVLGDVLVAQPGDQIVVDGQVLAGGPARMEVDESLLTGESDLVPKQAGASVYSGSFCVTGSALYEAQKVGGDSFANQITAGARAFRQVKTPLQSEIDFVIRVLVFLVSQLGILLAISFLMQGAPMVRTVQMGAVIVALVPQGLLVANTVSYTMGALRMAGKGVLIQQINAVESMSHVDVLCLDKTGTLTTNLIRLHAVHPTGISEPELARLLGDYAASLSVSNRTADAIGAAFAGRVRAVREEVPFSSTRQWSILSFDQEGDAEGDGDGVYVLGAPETLWPHLCSPLVEADLEAQADEWTARGLRVLLFAGRPDAVPLHDANDQPQLPSDLVPLGLLSFSDELRPEAQATLKGFFEAGIRLKIISGDNPQTVMALARQVGLGSEVRAAAGPDLVDLDDMELAVVAEEATIFGRITPQLKERLVRALRSRGHYVAMIGDGVNDVLSLKQAQLGIAMNSGSAATRSVADMVLLDDSFAALPAAFLEGQRILTGMQDVVRLLLTRTLYVILLVVGTAMVGAAFPLTPKNNTIMAALTVGIPTLALAAWARPGTPPTRLLRSVAHFVFPAAFMVAVASFAVYLSVLLSSGSVEVARTALTAVTVLCGLVLILFVEPPARILAGGDEFSGDWRPTILAVVMFMLFGVIMLVPGLREFFELTPLQWPDYVLIGVVVVTWGIALQLVWRSRLFERLLDINGRG